jgi:glycosyltransferase involved in cell wall biosynthesis
MANKRTVSVIIPTYNRSDVLRHSVESALNQTHPVTEVIIVDDGSTDDTAEQIDRQRKENPIWRERVRYIHQSNQGQSAANNTGIANAQGEWLGFNANDDLWLPTKLEMQFRALDKFGDKYGVCFTDAWFMNNPHMKQSVFEVSGKAKQQPFGVVEDATYLIGSGKHPIWMQTTVARTELVRQVGGVDPNLRYSEDHDFMFRLSLQTQFCFVSMPMVLIDRSPAEARHVGEARNWHKEEFCLRMDQYRFEKQLKLSESASRETRELGRQNLNRIHKAWANWHIERGEYREARQSISAAAKYGTSPGLAAKWLGVRLAPPLLRWAVARDRKSAVRADRVSWQDETIGVM